MHGDRFLSFIKQSGGGGCLNLSGRDLWRIGADARRQHVGFHHQSLLFTNGDFRMGTAPDQEHSRQKRAEMSCAHRLTFVSQHRA